MPFVDPTTGSGTIAIEAALIGRNIAPGMHRKFLLLKTLTGLTLTVLAMRRLMLKHKKNQIKT